MAGNNAIPWVGWTLSFYGAVLSTILAILHWRRDRGRFSINPEVVNIKFHDDDDTLLVWRLIEVVNVGRRPLFLEDFGVVKPNLKLESMLGRKGDMDFPLKIEEGQKYQSMTIEDRIASREIIKLWARDTSGKVYYSKKLPFGKDS